MGWYSYSRLAGLLFSRAAAKGVLHVAHHGGTTGGGGVGGQLGERPLDLWGRFHTVWARGRVRCGDGAHYLLLSTRTQNNSGFSIFFFTFGKGFFLFNV